MRPGRGEPDNKTVPGPGGPLDPAEGCFTATLIGVFVWLVVCGALAFWIWNLS